PGQNVRESAVFRIARDAELELDDEGGHDFLRAVEEELRNRRRSEIVRLEVEAQAGDPLLADLSPPLPASAAGPCRPPPPPHPGSLPRPRVLPVGGPAAARGPPRFPPPPARGGRPLRPRDLRRARRARHPPPPPLRVVRSRGGARERGRRRPRRARDQADPLPDERRLAGGEGALPRRGGGQAGYRARGADGALRR